MLFCPIGTSKSKEGIVAVYGFDSDTLFPIKANIPNDIVVRMDLRKTYRIDATIVKNGFPEYIVNDLYEVNDCFEVDDLLELSASSLDSILNDRKHGGLIRVDTVFKVDIGKNKASIQASIVGIPEKIYDISISDGRWVDYWENQKEYADCELIMHFLNSRKVYLFLEYEQSYSGDSISCVSMAVLK